MSLTADKVIEGYLALREKKSQAKAKYDNYVKDIDDKTDKLEVWLLENMDKVGTTQLKSDTGVAFVQTKTRASCADWPLFWNYLQENGRFDLMEKRVSSKGINEMLEESGELPPGVNIHRERTVTVRKS